MDENIKPEFDSGSVNSALNRIKNTLNYSLKENYGIEDPSITEKFLRMHGLDKDRFDFINNFERLIEKGIADDSIDTNANKADVSITGFFSETAMPINKLVGYRYLYRKLKDMYGKKRAKYLSGLMYDMTLAIADSTNILKPYSYYGHTLIYTSINGVERFYTLKSLFEKYSAYSNYDVENDMDVIYTDDIKKNVIFNKAFMKSNECDSKWKLYNTKFNPDQNLDKNNIVKENVTIKVWDDENGFVDITRIVRHRNNKGMILYQTKDGDFAFVTEDHPIYMEDGREIYAKDLKIGDKILDANLNLPENISLLNSIEMNDKMAYFLGFILGDGNLEGYDKDSLTEDSPTGCVTFTRGGNLVSIYQNDIKNSRIYNIAKELFPDCKFFEWQSDDSINPMTEKKFNKKNNVINFSSWDLNLLCSYYFEYGRKENSFTKHLPVNFMQWTEDAQDSFLAGVIDSDGFVTSNGLCNIKLKAYAAINGIYDCLSHRGIKTNKFVSGSNKNDVMFSVSFRPTIKMYEMSEKLHAIPFEDIDEYTGKEDTKIRNNEISKIFYLDVEKNDTINKKSFYFDELEYVYDITTSTGRFVANGMIQHNCYSINAQKLVFEGRPFGSLYSLPPKRIASYIHSLAETVHQLSNHLAGAIAVGSFFLDITYIMFFRENKTLNDLRDKSYRKYIKNELQSFVHSMNHLSRNSVECPFTNISIFDKPKLSSLLDENNLGWYFDQDPADENSFVPTKAIEDSKNLGLNWMDYVIKTIMEIQDIYMEVMDEGDRAHDGRPITFPVSTVNFSRVIKDGKRSFADEDFVKHICNTHDIMRYNIYISEGEKVASCCFHYDTPINFEDKDGNAYNMSLGEYVETRLDNTDLNDKETLEKKLSGDEFIRAPHGRIVPITGVIKLKNRWEELVKITFAGGDILWVTPNQKFLLKNEELCEAKDLVPGSLLYKYAVVESVDTYKSDEPVYDIEVGTEDHLFKIKLPNSGINVMVENCRLINDNELFELGGQVNSFGGSSLSLGSHRVVTINLRRAMLESDSWESFKDKVVQRMSEAADILVAHRSLIKDMINKGTQPFMTNGWLELDRMFSTFGIMGYYEAAKDAEKRFSGVYTDYLADMVTLIDTTSRSLSKERKNVFNVEEIPGESMAVKLANTDRWIFGEDRVPEPLYANQFVPLWEDATLYEKFKGEGELCAKLTGGGICHYSLGEKVTSNQAVNTIRLALEQGLEHFALNPTYAICENDHYSFGKHSVCPECGGKIVDNLTRTVGFFVRTSNMTTTKREEDYNKRHYNSV